jgi:hypothetical protein
MAKDEPAAASPRLVSKLAGRDESRIQDPREELH